MPDPAVAERDRRAIGGDPGALADWLAVEREPIGRFLSASLGDPDRVRLALIEGIEAIGERTGERPEGARHPRGWLYAGIVEGLRRTLAGHLGAGWIEHGGRALLEEEPEPGPLDEQIRRLPESFRTPLLLVRQAGLRPEEAAVACDCTLPELYESLHRALTKLALGRSIASGGSP